MEDVCRALRRAMTKPVEGVTPPPVEFLLDTEGWQAVWALVDALEEESPELVGRFGDDDEVASAILDELAARPQPETLSGLVSALVRRAETGPPLLVTVTLANVEMPRRVVKFGDDLVLVPTWDPDADGYVVRASEFPNDPQTQLERHFRDRPARGARRDRDAETGERLDTRATASLISVERAPRRRAVTRAETRARYTLAVWMLLDPPSTDPSDTTLWPTLARWLPAASQQHFPEVKQYRPNVPPRGRDDARGGTYLYGSWPLPEREVLEAPFAAIRAADGGSHFAGALLSAARALYLAAEPSNGLSTVERLVQVHIATEALGERPPNAAAKGRRFDRLADGLGAWEAVAADYGERATGLARERLDVWRNLAVHRAHSFRAQWGYRPGDVLRGQSGARSAATLNPAVAYRDLHLSLTAVRIAAAALFWIAHDAQYDDLIIEQLFAE